MNRNLTFILVMLLLNGPLALFAQKQDAVSRDQFSLNSLQFQPVPGFPAIISDSTLKNFLQQLEHSNYQPVIDSLAEYKKRFKLDDWLFYQMVRKAAEKISPKRENYSRYTFYKYFFLAKSGYDVMMSMHEDVLLFYVQSGEEVYNIPLRIKNGKQYVCLNAHDFRDLHISTTNYTEINLAVPEAKNSFSYKITKLPDFVSSRCIERNIQFTYNETNYRFKLRLDQQIQDFFANYPVVDYASYLNIPLGAAAYSSLIPALKKNLKGLSEKNGIDYLMRFVRSAFLFQPDTKTFGGEKRLSAEQTLFYNESDCEDRVGLLYYLIKEIYDVPMIVLTYPDHVSIAVKFKSPLGETITYQGVKYSICEPTPQKKDLAIGQMLPELKNTPFEVVYAYSPGLSLNQK